MTGKEKCELLRSIRREISERNGIEYLSSECHHEGDCLGTCPKCDAEAKFLNSELERLVREGKSVDFVTGVTNMYEKMIEEYNHKTTDYRSILDDIDEDDNEKYDYMGEFRIGDKREKYLNMKLNDIDLSFRTYVELKHAGIYTVEELLFLTYEDLMRVPHIGKKSCDEIIEKLAELGFELEHDNRTSEYDNKNIDPMEMPLRDLHLSINTYVALKRQGINTVEDLVNYKISDHLVMGWAPPGPDMDEVKEKLAEFGLTMEKYYE